MRLITFTKTMFFIQLFKTVKHSTEYLLLPGGVSEAGRFTETGLPADVPS